MDTPLTSKDFLEHLHSVFRIELPTALELELAQVTDRSNEHLEQFSVIFNGPASPWLRQGTYTLTHAALSQLDLFMVPLGPKEGKMAYEAVFSRRVATPARPAEPKSVTVNLES